MTKRMNSSHVEARQRMWWRSPLLAIFVAAILFNYPWELAQSPLYNEIDGLSAKLLRCLLASLGDGVLVLLIFIAGRVAFGRLEWFERPGVSGYVLMLAAGLVISVTGELVALHIAGWWTYKAQMPLLPGLNIGVTPVAQMLVLPPLIFRVVAAWRYRRWVKTP